MSEKKSVKKTRTPKTKKVEILVCPAAKYLMPESVGDVVDYPAALADEMVENKYAKFVK